MTSAAMSSGLLIAPVVAMIIYRHSPASAFMTLAGLVLAAIVFMLPRIGRLEGSERNAV